MKIIKQNLTTANNLGLESKAEFFSFFNGSDDLCKLHAEAKKIDAHVQIIGAGTNTIFPRAFNKLVIKSADKSISEKKVKNNILVTAGAALIWDELIDFCVEKKILRISKFGRYTRHCRSCASAKYWGLWCRVI